MKERPILFQAAMVRALLAGTKTQTRRAMKPQPNFEHARAALGGDTSEAYPVYDSLGGVGLKQGRGTGYLNPNMRSPYGQPGDRLWVREAHDIGESQAYGDGQSHPVAVYRADAAVEMEAAVRWRPSIHMPRWASRILLEVTEVRVERLRAISEADAIAEGIETMAEHDQSMRPTGRMRGLMRWPGEEPHWATPKDAYAALWESIHGADSWSVNPWVWAVSFKRVTP